MNRLRELPGIYFGCDCYRRVRIVSQSVPGAPEYLRGLRALFMSDLHLTRQVEDGMLREFVEKLRGTHADLLLLGGDYADTRVETERLLHALSAFRPPLGAYAALGNNDREAFAGSGRLDRRMRAAGIELLVNRRRTLRIGCGALEIAGIDEYKYGSPDAGALFDAAPAYRLLISHYPLLPDCGTDLMLSGHTHGGQFRIFGLTPYLIGFERRDALSAIYGFGRVRGVPVLVSNGVGTSRIPLRIGSAPEVHLLNFGS